MILVTGREERFGSRARVMIRKLEYFTGFHEAEILN